MASKIWDPVEQKLVCLQGILGEKDIAKRFLLNKVIDECLKLEQDERERFDAALAAETEVKNMVTTWKEALEESEALGEARGIALGEARGIALGEARGIALGETRGKVIATREAIELVVARRFGSVPPVVSERLAGITELSLLHDVLDAVSSARTLAQLDAAVGVGPDPGKLPV